MKLIYLLNKHNHAFECWSYANKDMNESDEKGWKKPSFTIKLGKTHFREFIYIMHLLFIINHYKTFSREKSINNFKQK